MLVVSACLCGINCKYNGANNAQEYFINELREGHVIPICPEQLGGLTTPRAACEILGGSGEDVLAAQARVIDADGYDLTLQFIQGARECLSLVKRAGINEAVLQRRSPSCGAGKIYNGSFSGQLIDGDGVTTALLKKHGIKVWNDEDYLQYRGACNS